MWEVIAKSKVTGDEIRHVTASWKEAKSLAMLALDVELRVQILKVYTDLLIADHDQRKRGGCNSRWLDRQ